MSSVVLAVEISAKTKDETVKLDMDFKNRMAAADSLSSFASTFPKPEPSDGNLTVNGALSGKVAQLTVGGGRAEKAFTADASTDTFTSTAHGFLDGDSVRLAIDDAEAALPGGVTTESGAAITDKAIMTEAYYVINKTNDTFQLSETSGGSAIDLSSDGQGKVFLEYQLYVRVTTSQGQTLEGRGRLWVRD